MPTMSAEVQQINAASNAILPRNWAVKYATSGGKIRWLVIEVTRTNAGIGIFTSSEYFYTAKTYTESNELIKSEKLGSDVVSYLLGSTQGLRDSTAQKQDTYKKAVALLEDKKTNNAPEEQADTVLAESPPPNTELNQVRWNPPPHFITRPPSFYDLANIGGGNASPTTVVNRYGKNATYKLGKIYQTKATAAALNKKAAKDPALVKADQLWGFRFLYNPKEITYGSQIDTAIDWMQQARDPSNFFGGNTAITVTLYLNRIADMKALRTTGPASRDYPGGALDSSQVNQILKRGTEYDLEYLYRTINGSPGVTSLVTDATLKTSDFGYITGMPVWIHIHDNMRYKGSLTNIEVNHVIFTESMIPTLSVVKLTFLRYPELDRVGKVKKTLEDNITNITKTTEK